MSASISPPAPFNISVQDPTPQLRELHLSFTGNFQLLNVEQRLEAMRAYIEFMINQAKSTDDVAEQKGLMMVIELTEQLLPHIQSNAMPLDQVLIVEMGEGAEGGTLEELCDKLV